MHALLAAKVAFDEAVSLRRAAAPLRAELSVLLLHDAVELGVLAAGRSVEMAKPKDLRLESLWPAVETGRKQSTPPKLLPSFTMIEPVVRARGNFKHNAVRVSVEQIGDFETYARTFLAEVARTFFGVEFDELSEVDLIDNATIRAALKAAERRLAQLETDAAMCRVADALAGARELLEIQLRWPGWIVTLTGPPIEPRTRAYLDSLSNQINATRFYVESGLLGLHPSERHLLELFVPRKSTANLYTFKAPETAPEIVAQCVRAAARYAIAVERFRAEAGVARWVPSDATEVYFERFFPSDGLERVVESAPEGDVSAPSG